MESYNQGLQMIYVMLLEIINQNLLKQFLIKNMINFIILKHNYILHFNLVVVNFGNIVII